MKIEFKNSYRSTRSGFAHDTQMFIDGQLEINATCHYLNRTWESYPYQSVMKQAIHLRIEIERSKIVKEYKRTNNRKRITKDVRESLTNDLIKNLRTYEKTI